MVVTARSHAAPGGGGGGAPIWLWVLGSWAAAHTHTPYSDQMLVQYDAVLAVMLPWQHGGRAGGWVVVRRLLGSRGGRSAPSLARLCLDSSAPARERAPRRPPLIT